YRVSCIGFTPGFPFLSGLHKRLATRRRSIPRKEIPAGSVAIAGAQTGIYPMKSPGGWNIIGRTPLHLFDPRKDPPALLRPGDRVRFRASHARNLIALPIEDRRHSRGVLNERARPRATWISPVWRFSWRRARFARVA